MPTNPTIARIWRGRTRPDVADAYEPYLRAEGIPPLEKTALASNCCAKIVVTRRGSQPSHIGPTCRR